MLHASGIDRREGRVHSGIDIDASQQDHEDCDDRSANDQHLFGFLLHIIQIPFSIVKRVRFPMDRLYI